MPTIAVIAPGAMGSAIAARLSGNGSRVVTSLDGRGAASRARAEPVGMVHAADPDLAAADILLAIVPPAIRILAAERAGAGAALRPQLAENEPALLARFARGLPDMAPKADRWAPEMEEIAGFLGPDAAGRRVFDGYAGLYRHLAAEAGEADIAALIRFAAEAAAR